MPGSIGITRFARKRYTAIDVFVRDFYIYIYIYVYMQKFIMQTTHRLRRIIRTTDARKISDGRRSFDKK